MAPGAPVAVVDLSNGATIVQQAQVAAASAENGSGGGGSGGSTASVAGSTNNNGVATMCQCILVLDPFPSQSVWR